MTSRSERRRACQARAVPPESAARASRPAVDSATGTCHYLGALDEPAQLYRVLVSLAAGDAYSDGELGRAYCALRTLVPLSCDWQMDRLVCELLCTAPSADAAAWRVVEHVRELTELPLLAVEVGLPGAAAPEVVLSSVRGLRDDGARG